MSVDTYLKGKNTSAYAQAAHGDVEVLVAPSMARWSNRITIDIKRGLLGRRFDVAVEHQHGPACQH
ncbi:hypothetical protein ER308_08385 [Egibacter rhizosphaerae]|uniref:Uncharacterized protein n=1 Tax=Egibacter rhizosphaerae TaxID=1670831 RepID=A0A411YEE3_9ACTN|nr:hypothetical protein [Egibacter rhizosphaerae]QBI19566.1 hypothetical protein ER308_08385 [Egibacter rhizosphaerae]